MKADNPKQTARCPHCGNTAAHEIKLYHSCSEVSYCHDDDSEYDLDILYYAATCGTCSGLSLYCTAFGEEPVLEDACLLWPVKSMLDKRVPAAVAECYLQAARVKHADPSAFAVMIRRALEALCSDLGAKKGNLHRRLAALVAQQKLPSILADMTSVLQAMGNAGAHGDTRSVRWSNVDDIDRFFRAVVEYVYVAPARLAEFKERLGRLGTCSARQLDAPHPPSQNPTMSKPNPALTEMK